MFGLPKTTELSKQLPKKAIYAKFNMNTAAREKFDADISRITIVAEISPATVNIVKGENVSAIYVLLVSLKRKEYNVNTVITLSKLIEQNMLLVLEYEHEQRLAIYRNKLLQGEWAPSDSISVNLNGLNLDTVWENMIEGLIGNEELGIRNEELSVDEKIALIDKQNKIKKEIERLEKAARNEKQPKKKFELVQQVNKLKNDLEEIHNG